MLIREITVFSKKFPNFPNIFPKFLEHFPNILRRFQKTFRTFPLTSENFTYPCKTVQIKILIAVVISIINCTVLRIS